MTGKIEALRQVNPWRHEKQSPTAPPHVLNPVNRLPERLRVERPAVADTAEIGDGNGVGALAVRDYAGACYRVGVTTGEAEGEEEE